MTETYGLDIQYGDVWKAREGQVSRAYPVKHYTRPRLTKMFHALAAARREGIYIPNESSGCKTCTQRKNCVLMREL